MMAVAKSNQELKREKQREKRQSLDRLTNRFMINLAWGIVGIVALRFVENGYGSASTILQMPTTMKVFAGIFAVLAVGLFVCGRFNVLKNTCRCYNYAIFSAVIALISLWIGFYAQIRLFFVNIIPALGGLDSRWWISWGPIAAVIIYLVVMLIWTGVRVAVIEKGKK